MVKIMIIKINPITITMPMSQPTTISPTISNYFSLSLSLSVYILLVIIVVVNLEEQNPQISHT